MARRIRRSPRRVSGFVQRADAGTSGVTGAASCSEQRDVRRRRPGRSERRRRRRINHLHWQGTLAAGQLRLHAVGQRDADDHEGAPDGDGQRQEPGVSVRRIRPFTRDDKRLCQRATLASGVTRRPERARRRRRQRGDEHGGGGMRSRAAVGTLTATNYDFTPLVNGTLTITKAHLTVTANDKSRAYPVRRIRAVRPRA